MAVCGMPVECIDLSSDRSEVSYFWLEWNVIYALAFAILIASRVRFMSATGKLETKMSM